MLRDRRFGIAKDDDEQAMYLPILAGYMKVFKDAETRAQFHEYRAKSLPKVRLFLLTIYISGIVYPTLITDLADSDSEAAAHIKISVTILATLGFLSVWVHCCSCIFRSAYERQYEFIRGFSIITTTIALSLQLFRRSSRELMQYPDYLPIYGIHFDNIYSQISLLAMDNAIWLALVPTSQIIVTREYRLSVVLSTYVITLTALAISTPTVNYGHSAPIIFGYGLFGGMILLDYVKQHFTMFFLHRKLLNIMLTKERNAEELRRHEMRHMIANVAHDLKSPLSSFMSGIEVINEEIKVLEINSIRLINKDVSDCINSIESTTKYVQNVNNFMLMTINRCLDCTKASNGLKLTPNYETLDLQETLSLPVECMSNTQQKISIELSPWNDRAICSHIITDKQWLQENILCLLSNAVKYSSEGSVTVSVSLKSKDFFPGQREKSAAVLEAASTNAISSETSSVTQTRTSSSHSSIARIISLFTLAKYKVLPAGVNPESCNGTATVHSLDNEFSNQNRKKKRGFGSVHSLFNVTSAAETQPIDSIEFLVFSIEDTGIGMSDEARKHLFNPFKQNQRLAGGTGLGLYSLSKRIDALEGIYGVDKRKDGKQGSLFWFAIPYKPDFEMSKMAMAEESEKVSGNKIAPLGILSASVTHQMDESVSVSNHFPNLNVHIPNPQRENDRSISATERLNFNHSRVPHSPGRDKRIKFLMEEDKLSAEERSSAKEKTRYKILIADDTASVAKMMKRLLERHGHFVKTVGNGATALKVIQKQIQSVVDGFHPEEQFDLVLMDLQMPVMDGLEASRRIRSFEEEINQKHNLQCHQAIICVSANGDTETMEEAREAGIDAFIPKPFTYETFITAVEHLFDQMKNYN